MIGMIYVYATISVVALAIAIWLNTKTGKRWLEDL